jgi:short-subunit dehydrogenase
MTSIKGKVVAVTGAGSGIGRALAHDLVARGAHVALSDKDEQSLSQTAQSLGNGTSRVTTRVVDVSDRLAVEAYARAVVDEHGAVDIIINNAGVAARGSIEDIPYDEFRMIVEVNLWGVIHGTRAFLPFLRERPEGHIVNISSIVAMVPVAFNGPYQIAKSAVYALNETLMEELIGSNVRITSVHPSGVRTNFVRNALHVTDADVARHKRRVIRTPESAAKVILDAVEKNRKVCLVGWDAHVMSLVKRLAPGFTIWLAGNLSRLG